jgi:hypothetical protein
MRRLWLWRLGIAVVLITCATAGLARAGDDDTPEPAPKPRYGRGPGLMDRLLAPTERPAEKKPVKKETDKKETDKKAKDRADKPAAESAAAIRAREQAAWERRSQVCLKLMDLANQQNDMDLYRRAEELEQRAWAVYLQRTAHLPAGSLAAETDEEIIARRLGEKTTAGKNNAALTSGTAKNKDRNSQAAAREEKP